MKILEYKNYQGSAELDLDRNVCRGKLLFITDLVTYESDTIAGLRVEFEAAVDDYLETCAELGKEPVKPVSGQFNVRVPPQLHRDLAVRAKRQDMKLNEAVNQAFRWYCYGAPTTHNHTYEVTLRPEPFSEALASSSQLIRQVEVSSAKH